MNYEEFYREQCDRDSDDFVLDDDLDLDDIEDEDMQVDDGSQTDEMDVVDLEDEDKSLDADDEDQYDPEPIPLEYDGYNDADNY
tara:strand:+ start:3810 stop:4061 length:252 start_codon:yes stop_codon:yes gene_type:complete